MYIAPSKRINNERLLDTSKLMYSYQWEDIASAVKDKNRGTQYLKKESIAVYPDTTVWVKDFNYAYNEPLFDRYFWHKAYKDYPVVGVTWDQARAFCDYKTKAKRDYVKSGKKRGDNPMKFRLPTEAEWEYAARGGMENATYPWGGPYLTDDRGCYLANFKPKRGNYIEDEKKGTYPYTAPVKRFHRNGFGLYDMAGNVAEWVQDVYRPMVDDEANDFNYFRGNVYTKNKIGEDGVVELVTSDNITYDTLSNGRIMARNFPGQIAQVPVDENETYLRTQFSTSDNRNYRDGDRQSTRYYKFNDSEEGSEGGNEEKFRMYEAPKHSITADSLGKMDKKFDKSNKRTTLVDDNVRVYKGGSWRDRAYWLDPASRRFFPQDMATDYIGFRCAMSKVGPKSNKKTPRGNPKK